MLAVLFEVVALLGDVSVLLVAHPHLGFEDLLLGEVDDFVLGGVRRRDQGVFANSAFRRRG